VDDGVRAGLITVDDLLDVRVFSRFHAVVVARYPELPPRRVLYETIRRMVDYLVSDVITQSQKNIVESSVDSIQAVRAHSRQLISLSENSNILSCESLCDKKARRFSVLKYRFLHI